MSAVPLRRRRVLYGAGTDWLRDMHVMRLWPMRYEDEVPEGFWEGLFSEDWRRWLQCCVGVCVHSGAGRGPMGTCEVCWEVGTWRHGQGPGEVMRSQTTLWPETPISVRGIPRLPPEVRV